MPEEGGREHGSDRRTPWPSADAWFRRMPGERLARLASTPGQVATLLEHRGARALARRPAPDAWAPVEVVCHLRDTDEAFGKRFAAILAMSELTLAAMGPADRWAVERQYLRHGAATALAHFRGRRGESLETLVALTPAQWQRGGEHSTRGGLSIDMLVALMAWRDDNHLEQLTRAVEGKP
jgi:DinB superfamily